MQRILLTFFVASLSFCFIGCGGHGTVPVSITITQNGTPLAGVTVTAISSDGKGNSTSGMTNVSGVAVLETTQGWNGAFPGEYNVAVSMWEGYLVPSPSAEYPNATTTEQRNVLPAKYGEHSTSGFTLTIGNRATTMTFNLEE